MLAKYWIAQRIEDLFRNEPRNVGVFVQIGDCIAAKFFGENTDCQIDGRKIKSLTYPDVYKQWVEYWRSQIAKNDPNILVKTSGSHYRVVQAGEVTDIDHDSPDDVVNYLYAMLVTEGGLKAAIGVNEEMEDKTVVALENDLLKELREGKLLGDENEVFLRHPVKQRVPVYGQKHEHRPAFVQENGHLYVMETVDFTIAKKKYSKDHAGLVAYMFEDIRSKQNDAECIAVIKITDEDSCIDDVAYGLKIIKSEASVVNWLNSTEKKQFFDDRKTIAETN